MKVLLCLALAADMGIAAHAVELQTKINWSDFLSRHDLVWDELPKVWHESAFIGNGLLGATIYSETNTALQWDVGRSDVADRGNRLQIGRFLLDPARCDLLAGLVERHWPERIAPDDLGEPALWRQCRTARAALLAGLGFGPGEL